MKEAAIIQQIRSEIDEATEANVDVRTVGGDQNVGVPEVILEWNHSRIPGGNGHSSFGGYVTDSNGEKIGVEHHTYWTMEVDCVARFYTEADRDAALNTIQSAFIPYENDSSAFNADTREWDVGSTEPRNNPVLEPDWYEAGILLTFEYMKRVEETGKDTLSDIEYDIQISESL